MAACFLEDTIERHAGEARDVTHRFGKLTAFEKQRLTNIPEPLYR